MSEFLYTSQESLGFMTITVNRLMNLVLRRHLRDRGIDLTGEQWGVLVMLWNRDGATQEELANFACVDKSSMSRVLALMEDKGLVVRRIDPDNARCKRIRASEAALEIQERSLSVVREVLDVALEGVSDEDHATCLRVLDMVKRNLLKNGTERRMP